MTRREVLTALISALIGAPLAACGRRGVPIPPEGSTYPRQYPNVTFPAEKRPGSPEDQE